MYVRQARAGVAGVFPARSLVLVRPRPRMIRRGGLGQYSPSQIQALVTQYANQYGVPPALALSVAYTESRFNPNALSPAGAIGVMQLMPATAAGLNVNPNDVEQNISGGVQYLAQLLNQYGGDQSAALWAYNAGPGNEAKGILPAETQNYISTVLNGVSQFGGDTSASGGGDSLAPPADLGGDLSNILNTGSVDLSSLFDTSAGSDGSSLLPWLIGGVVLAGVVWALS